MVLACERSTPVDQLRRDIGVDTAELQSSLTAMRDRNYITTSQDVVAITAEGEQAVAALWAVQERVEEDLYTGFTSAEREQLQALLHRIQSNVLRLAGATESQSRDRGGHQIS
jgi:TrmH family RNA methyltransferase